MKYLSVLLVTITLTACGGADNGVIPEIPSYSIGGTVSGLNGSVVLLNNGRDELTVSEDGAFEFSDDMGKNQEYAVTVLFHPKGSSCVISNDTGTVTDHDITNVAINCALPASPELELAVSPKFLNFNWPSINDIDTYNLYESDNEESEFTLLKGNISNSVTNTTVAHDHPVAVHNFDWDNVRYRAEACSGDTCSAPSNQLSTNSLSHSAIGYLKAMHPGIGYKFGYSIALSGDGNTLAIGSPFEARKGVEETDVCADKETPDDENAIIDCQYASGAVYIYALNDTSWEQQGYIKPSHNKGGDQFGYSLAISDDGNTLAIGAPGESGSTNTVSIPEEGGDTDNLETSVFSGAAYIFTRTNNEWTQEAYIKASNASSSDRFGATIALNNTDATTLVVGAPHESCVNDTCTWAGAVYTYALVNNIWTASGPILRGDNTEAQDLFGHAVKLSANGQRLAVSAIGESGSDNSLTDAGAVYTFNLESNTWAQSSIVRASNPDANDQFGSAIDLSSDGFTLAVSAPFESSNTTGININSDQNNNDSSGSGAVYLFSFNDTENEWTEEHYIKATNPDVGDRFGTSVALNGVGSQLAISATFESSDATSVHSSLVPEPEETPEDETNEDNNDEEKEEPKSPSSAFEIDNSAGTSGAVYFFTKETNGWLQRTYIKAPNTGSGDHFGHMIDLDASGDSLAISADRESSNGSSQTNNSFLEAGAVYLY